jgi:hypothetical protein
MRETAHCFRGDDVYWLQQQIKEQSYFDYNSDTQALSQLLLGRKLKQKQISANMNKLKLY